MKDLSTITSTSKKYNTRNPLSRYLVRNYFNHLKEALTWIQYGNILEVGSGEGVLLANLQKQLHDKQVFAIDIDRDHIKMAYENYPFANFNVADAHDLPFPTTSFDLVICCETLEHLKDPQRAIKEIQRVTKKYCILTVPNEPVWRLLNLVRGSYIRDFGNTPSHINHWGKNSFMKLISQHFEILGQIRFFPWIGILCRISGSNRV
jgi:ubiquinone/menaquinone biosynthesis C-methylase UbiE